jgi:hypothetical protein
MLGARQEKTMKKTIYIHMGPIKTGSTAIQYFLSSNENILLKNGFHYVKTLRWNDQSHSPLVWILYHKYSKHNPNKYSNYYVMQQDTLLQTLSDEINYTHHKHYIISSENIFYLNSEAIDDLIEILGNHEIQLIAYIRDVRSQSISLASQVIKNKEDDVVDDRLSNIYNTHISFFYRHYPSCFDLWASKIGKINLIFRKYGNGYFFGGHIYSDILDAFGIELTDEYILPDKMQNKSLTLCETIYFKDIINRLSLKTDQITLIERLLEWERLNRGTKFSLPNDLLERIDKEAERIHSYLIDNFIDDTYYTILNKRVELINNNYTMSYNDFINILDYMIININGFKEDFMGSLIKTLDKSCAYIPKINELDNAIKRLTNDKTPVAIWGCGDIAQKLFKRHCALEEEHFYVVDEDVGKQNGYIAGHKIMPPSIIATREIDTVIVSSIKYADEISREIGIRYPNVKNIIKLADLLLLI